MNIIEALTLARDHGKKVRPVCWAEAGGDIGIVFAKGNLLCVYDGSVLTLQLGDVRELLGEWEVVP